MQDFSNNPIAPPSYFNHQPSQNQLSGVGGGFRSNPRLPQPSLQLIGSQHVKTPNYIPMPKQQPMYMPEKNDFHNSSNHHINEQRKPRTPEGFQNRPQETRLYVTLKREIDDDVDFQKLITMVSSEAKISELKRRIQKQFMDLFPTQQPFIVAKIQDQYGYSLSNSSVVGEILRNGDRVTALPQDAFFDKRELGQGGRAQIHGNQDPYDLVSLLNNVQQSVASKLAVTSVHEYQPIDQLLHSVLPLAFSRDSTTIQNTSIVLNKSLHQGNVRIFDRPQNHNLVILARQGLRYWIQQFSEKDNYILTNTVEILDLLCHSDQFLRNFKNEGSVSKLLSLSKYPDTPAALKSKIFRAISHLSTSVPKNPPLTQKTQSYQPQYSPKLNKQSGIQNRRNFQQPASDNTIADYCMMLYADDNNRDVTIFAIQNLANVIEGGIRQVMVNSDRFLGALRVIEFYNLPREAQKQQMKIMSFLAQYMNEARAFDALNFKFLTKLTKAYNYFDPGIRDPLKALLSSILAYGKNHVDIPSLISLIYCPFPQLQQVGMTMIKKVSDALVSESSSRSETQFESHIPFLVETCLSKKQNNQYKNQAIGALANLSLRDFLKPHILHHRGMETFLSIIKQPFEDNVEGKRIAAKGLVNLTSNKRQLRMKAVSELGDIVKQLYRNELDSIIAAYLQTLIHKK